MPKVTSSASDKQDDLMSTVSNVMPSVMGSYQAPMIITAVQRKVNTGNFETIDVYVAVALPITDALDFEDQEMLDMSLTRAVDFGMGIASRETGERYNKLSEKYGTKRT